jgi:hypothetical protein
LQFEFPPERDEAVPAENSISVQSSLLFFGATFLVKVSVSIGGHRRLCGPRDEDTQNECETHGLIHFVTRSQMNRVSTTGLVSSAASTRKVIRSGPWNVYHRRVALPTALGF